MHGGEVFVPKIPSMSIIDLASRTRPTIAKSKKSESARREAARVLISEDEARQGDRVRRLASSFNRPTHGGRLENWTDGTSLPDGFFYTSDNNTDWLDAVATPSPRRR